MTVRSVVLGVWLVLAPATVALAEEAVAVLTEIKRGTGTIEVRRVATSTWSPAQPLLSLSAGDAVRVVGDGRAVVLLAGGAGPRVVTAGNSPFAVPALRVEGTGDRIQSVLSTVTGMLIGQPRQPVYHAMTIRAGREHEPVLLGPRDSLVLPGAMAFEWAGPARNPYRLRVSGPRGVVWEQRDLPPGRVAYPASAPALVAGERYTWELETRDFPARRATFEILPAADAARVQTTLGMLEPAALPDYPANTVACLRAAVLFQDKLWEGARRELQVAIASSPDEATLRFLLAHVYERTGLRQLAAQELERARALAAGRE